jgi:class 3 adenylate cyclase
VIIRSVKRPAGSPPAGFFSLVGQVEDFLVGRRLPSEPESVLATILFTDIVDSTGMVARLGDRGWTDLLCRHHAVVRRNLELFHGRELDTSGDGFFAAFDVPARAIRCARAISNSMTDLDLMVRAGIHTGECEPAEGKLAGIAVHIAARIASAADPGEQLVSSTVKDLVAGSQIQFINRGCQPLKGIPGKWQIYAVGSITES